MKNSPVDCFLARGRVLRIPDASGTDVDGGRKSHKRREQETLPGVSCFCLSAFRLNINPWFYQGWVRKALA